MATLYNKVTLSTIATNQQMNFTEFELFDTNEVNIALAGLASQTSIWGPSVASIANNGFNDGTVSPGDTYSFTATGDNMGGEWTLDLAQDYPLSDLTTAVFYNRITSSQSEKNRAIGMEFKLHSTDGSFVVTFGTGTGADVQTFDMTTISQTFNQATLSAVASGQVLNFTEFELYTTQGVNIAVLGTASQSSTFQSSVAPIAINGLNDGTIASGDTYNFAATTGGGTWTLDLDRGYLISELSEAIFYNRITTGGEASRTIGMIATLHSSDGKTTGEIGVGTADLIQTFVIKGNSMSINPGISTMNVRVSEVSGALSYRVAIDEDMTGGTVYDITFAGVVTEYVAKAQYLTPGTAYTSTLYINSGTGLEQYEQLSTQTLLNSSENYDITHFGGNGKYDLSTLGSDEFQLVNDILGDLFSTGETLNINISGRDSNVSFVKLGETVSIDDSILAPFNSSSGTGQNFTLQLSDNSTQVIGFNEASNSITVGASEYAENESFVLDGKKCSIKAV